MRYWKPKPVAKLTVGLAVATYAQEASLAALAGCLRAQTYPHFVALAVHDGPAGAAARASWPTADPRFRWTETPARRNAFGHNCRRLGLETLLADPGVAYLGTTNGDNLYAPVYFEALVHAMQSQKRAWAYCNMVHSHKGWMPLKTEPKRGRIDAGCWLAERRLIEGRPWSREDFAADWFYLEGVARAAKPAKVDGYLFYHN
jgi:hypothetical protein